MSNKTKKTIEEKIKDRTVLENFIKEKEWSELIDAKDLIGALNGDSPSQKFSQILGNPGCYKWWAREDDVKDLLCKIIGNNVDFDQLKGTFEHEEGTDFYCIYVGKADCLRDRLKHHAKHLFQSTLRRTIFSLYCPEEKKLEDINRCVDDTLGDFKVKFFSLDKEKWKKAGKNPYKLEDLNFSILDLEYYFINEKFHILNVDENVYAEYNNLDANCADKTKEIVNALKDKKWSKKRIQKKLANKT